MRAALFGFYETHSILLTIHPKARSCFAAGSVGSPPQDVSSLLRADYAAYGASALLLGSQRSRFTLWAALGRLSPLRFDSVTSPSLCRLNTKKGNKSGTDSLGDGGAAPLPF
jgi:hypothetical protein